MVNVPGLRTESLPQLISAELDSVVAKAMQRDPEKRYQTALEMRRALEATPEGKQLSTGVQGVTRQAAFATDNSATKVARPTQRGMPPISSAAGIVERHSSRRTRCTTSC